MCQATTDNTYMYGKFTMFDRCDFDKSSSVTSLIGSSISMPAYVTYIINWFSQFRTTLMNEIYNYGVPILYSFIAVIVCAYLYVCIILLLTKLVVITSSAIMPLIFMAGIALFIYLYIDTLTNTNFNFNAFGYTPSSNET